MSRQCVEELALQPRARQQAQAARPALANRRFQGVQALHVERPRQLVVDGRGLGLHQLLHVYLVDRFLAGQIGGAILVGKGDLHLHLVARPCARQLILEPRNEAARAKLQRVTLGLAAGEILSLHATVEVDDDHVTVPAFTIAGDRQRDLVRLGEALQRLVHLVVADVNHKAFERHGGEIQGLDLGHEIHRHRELEVAPILETGHLDARLPGGAQPALGERLHGRVVEGAFQHISHDRGAVAFAQQGDGHLSPSESRQLRGLGDLAEPLGELFLDGGGGNPDLELPPQPLGFGFRSPA